MSAAVVHFVVADPLTAPPGYGAGTLAASRDHGVVALVLCPHRQRPALRMLLSKVDALALARQLTRSAKRLPDLPS